MILTERQNICVVLYHYIRFLRTNESLLTDKYVDTFIFFLYFPNIFMLAKADVVVAFMRYVFPEVTKDKLITSQKRHSMNIQDGENGFFPNFSWIQEKLIE